MGCMRMRNKGKHNLDLEASVAETKRMVRSMEQEQRMLGHSMRSLERGLAVHLGVGRNAGTALSISTAGITRGPSEFSLGLPSSGALCGSRPSDGGVQAFPCSAVHASGKTPDVQGLPGSLSEFDIQSGGPHCGLTSLPKSGCMGEGCEQGTAGAQRIGDQGGFQETRAAAVSELLSGIVWEEDAVSEIEADAVPEGVDMEVGHRHQGLHPDSLETEGKRVLLSAEGDSLSM